MLLSSTLQAAKAPKIKDPETALEYRDLDKAISMVEKPKEYKDKEKLLYYLDAGMLYHYQGDWQKSNELLSRAEDAIVELYTKSLSTAAASMLLNDNALDYSGEDYEDVYINVFKALNYLHLNDRDAAMVEIRRVDDKLAYLEQKHAKMAKEMASDPQNKADIKAGKNKFHSSALARYLSMLLYLYDGKSDDARIDYDNVGFAFQSQPEIYPFSQPELIHPNSGQDSPILRVVSFVNSTPIKREREMHIHTSKDLLLIGSVDKTIDVYPIAWEGIDEGYYFKFAIPYLEDKAPRVGRVEAVTADGSRYRLSKLEDMGLVARRTFEIKEPMILLKSVARSVMKGVAAEAAKDQAQKKTSSLVSSLLSLAADAAVFFSENADLRLSKFFPANALIAEIPISAGTQELTIEYYSPQGALIFSETKTVEIAERDLNLVESWHF
ncbi:MAG TPA: hypothetical protein PKI59_01255 [Candidatus Cloacimonadota bacterium]|nr:hypothetical protein [Candidatus Cloacimonadota bacterium]